MFRILVVLMLAISMLPSTSSALVRNEHLGDINITMEGATRTKLAYMESLVKRCLEKSGDKAWETVDSATLQQCITNTRHFAKVEVRVNRPEIAVTIKERWTLLPIPNMYASNGKRSAGVFVYDSNFLGYGKVVGAGGAVSTEGNTFSLMYFDPAVQFTNATFNIMASRSNTETDAYDKTMILYGYKKTEAGFTVSPGYKVTPFITISLSANYSDKNYSELEAFAVPRDYTYWGLGARAAYRNADYKLFYNDGFTASLGWNKQMHRTDQEQRIAHASASLEWDLTMFGKHALQLGLRGSTQSSTVTEKDVSTYGRGKGYRGIQSQGLWSRQIAAVSADYQVPVAKWGHGTVTVAPFLDYGTYKPFFAGTGNNYTAYGVGAYYYINLISLPGIGLTAGMNDDFMGSFVAFQVGMGFN